MKKKIKQTKRHSLDFTFLSIFILLIIIINSSFKIANVKKYSPANDERGADTLYKPKKKDILLFYIQLSENHNIIVYDINYNADKTVNASQPVHTYWIRYSEKGQNKELTYFQRHLVYGLETKLIDKEKQAYTLEFVSYKKKKIYLSKTKVDNKYNAYMDIHGKISLLSKIFIQVEPRTFGLPTVKYVDLYGKEISTNNTITERIIP
jgi:hypothetical protein